jgi:hypothetical protein
MATDLFGDPIAEASLIAKPRRLPPGKAWKGGYAAAPGSGPALEKCGTCAHSERVCGGQRSYYKCGLMRRAWTHGPGSDIKLKTPACGRWEPEAVEL